MRTEDKDGSVQNYRLVEKADLKPLKTEYLGV